MKRLFQRPGSTASIRAKQSAPSSPNELGSSPDAQQKQRTRRSYSPERLMQSLSFGGSKTSKEKAESPPSVAEAAPFAAISTVKPQPASPRSTPDDLREQVAAYAAATTEESQFDAIKAIYEMICVEDDTMRIQMSEVDARVLVGVCSQRLRVDFQRRLERINSYKLEGQVKSETDNAELELSIATVAVVDRVLKDTSSTHVGGIIKERLPSTVVKVLQASDNGALKLDSRIVDHCLSLLMTLVQFSDTARELFETSTLHRLFFFKFASLKHQHVGLQIVETLAKSIQRDMRRKLISHVEEYQCLFGLLEAIVDGRSFEKVVIITGSVLRSAYDDGIVSLHKQLRTAHYYDKLLLAFRSVLDRDLVSVEAAKDQVSRIKQRHTSIRSAISELCLSGCEEAIALRVGSTEKCFQLAGPKPKASMFNCEAFLMLCQMLKHLRLMINREPNIDDGVKSREWLEELECQYIQKVGRIVAQNRFDYLFLRRTAILEDLIKHIDVYPELTKLAVGSVLEAAAIETSVVLYPELTALATTLIQIRAKLSDEVALSEHKSFGSNLKEFFTLAVLKMQMWQHPQHGDGCPKVFECCDKVHFAGGPIILLDLALFVLGETPTGSTTTSATATLSNMISDSLNKGKKRRQLRQMLGRMSLSKSAELASLTSCMYTVLNAVVTHLLQGHRSEVADEDLVEVLQLLHLNREVFMSPRNNQDKNVFVCLCRYLLQFLTDPNAALRHVAARLWVDLMKCQRALMVEILTVELRRSGAPYSINLMKNGFDVLLDCPDDSASDQGSFLESASFQKFHHWLEVVGPPLKELETKLDRVFLKSMVESKEVVRDAWLDFHRRTTQHKAKESKRFASRLEWFTSMEREYVECLLEMQQREFSRQRKWRQDRIDRQKFIAREWYQLRQNLLEQGLGPEPSEDNHSAAIQQKSILLPQIIEQSRTAKACVKQQAQLDMTEGPRRMRKRFVTSTSTRRTFENLGMEGSLQRPPSALPEGRRGILRRRFSDSDLLRIKAPIEVAEDSRALQKDRVDMSKMGGTNLIPRPPGSLTRRGSFETLFPRADQDTSEYSMETSYALGSRRKDSQSTIHDSGDEGERDADETSGTGAFITGFNSEDDDVDEKLRPLLVPGDEVMDIYDCLRVDGMDSCPGVFIMCNDNVYIIDNYQVAPSHGRHGSGGGGSDARVVEVSREAPTRLERRLSLRFQHLDSEFSSLDQEQHLTTPGGRLLSLQRSSFTHQCRFWSYDDILEIHKRRHQLRHVAIELFAHDGRNYLITFESQTQRENVFHSLLAKCPNVRGAANGMDRTAVSGDLYSQLRKLLRQNMTERWIAREITNFEYLMHLNTLAGRSYNDLTQYPVFPWILSDYSSPSLDLDDPAVYRDLAKPMGALFREEEFRTRYESLAEGADEDDPMSSKPFHYGTHYSSAGIVLHYLMRMEPFTTQFLRLQGGKFDHADRLFSSVAGAWKSAAGFESAQNGTQDVKELIPEFFYLPAFLKNVNHHEFGKDQNGVAVNDVELPPWANGSAREFVRIHREALESEFVSANLHHWIDLIFGYKQQGAPAVEACNVFYHLTYEGAVDLDSISDANMKRAIVDQISEFGQIPSQLFKTPHPSRVRGSAPSSGSITHTQPNSGTASLPPATATGSESAPSSSSFMGNIPSSPAPTSFGSLGGSRGLASSFIEGSDIMSRVHNMLTSSSLGSGVEDSVAILDQAAFLQQEPRRELALNPVVSAHRGFSYSSVGTLASRGRQLSSGALAASIRQIEMTVASVTREEKIIATSDKCLLVPPRFHEFLAWGFQDRSLKVLSSGSFEGGHSGDSKVVISFEIDFPISVGCITSDGRTFIAGGAAAPVIRIWQFSSKKASSATLLQRKRTYGAGLHSSNPSVRSLIPMTTLSTPSHRGSITAVQACRAFSVIVSGCSSGVAVLWDLNRFRFVRTLPTLLTEDSGPNDSIGAIAINESTGDITVALGAVFGVYDINGDLLTRLSYETLLYDPQFSRARITSIAVNRSEASEWAKEKTVITGHADGVLCIWAYSHTGFGEDEWGVDLRGRHLITKSLGHGTSTSRSAITAVYLSTDERKLLTGNADGLLSVWTPSMQPSAPNTPTSTPSVPSPLQT
ncbi:hypothetical protein Poli38472_006717 [Pythium oligandrum]|uniref:Beach-domain-containing protein n=1 Tax=Pythium oligandrum TaxID=41045 RepID=A0A8K1C549_PYTOL|nr:hypothetical protein Poli38472_006717 [Pythium oligandrum]|eukprot:TMW56707.1 hypothetical protein Poli38472_006717 [Pythium oligandrum]